MIYILTFIVAWFSLSFFGGFCYSLINIFYDWLGRDESKMVVYRDLNPNEIKP